MSDALEFKSSQLSLTLVRIHASDMTAIGELLTTKLAKAGKFLRGAPVVVDPLCGLSSVQLAQLLELLRQHQLTPVGIRTKDAHLVDYAEMCGLAVFKPSAVGEKNSEATTATNTTEAPAATVAESVSAQSTPSNSDSGSLTEKEAPSVQKALRIPSLRSGQFEKHLLNDVIVEGGINSGAELFVGGNITVLGAVRGRLHAGAAGDRTARIIAKNFNPELVSIAGIFLLADDIPQLVKQGWVEIYLEQNSLKFKTLD
ncbi:MAG: septum site-determining protein MinC [Gammaproteobacteria bacterium]|nr:septum site-determining protein MinC [Gammaproteobacteria bacterium]